jgi:hypothetical protein
LAEAVKAYQRVAEGKARFRAVLTCNYRCVEHAARGNTQLVRDALLRVETVNGAKLERRSHIRID